MRHRHVLAAATAAATLLALTTATATAAAATTAATPGTPHSSKRVCANAPAGFAACQARVVTSSAKSLRPLATAGPTGYSPAQLNTAYGLTGFTGTAKIAIVDAFASPNAASDLAAYRSQFGLGTASFTQVNQTGGPITTVSGDVGWGHEEMLDLDMASAICPGCPLLYIGSKSNSFTDLAAAVNQGAAQGAQVISNSYGGSEFFTEITLASAYNHPGIAITASSGDSGFGAQIPAAFKTVTAVGGTTLTLNTDSTRKSETVWSGAGSGCSRYISKPSWQTDSGCSRRTIADVAADADPATGVSIYDTFGSSGGLNWLVFGGTSVAAPIIGAIYALTGSDTAGVPAQLAYTSRASLFDVTSGNNGSCSRGTQYLCTGGTGYDGPTGNGTPNASLAPF
ncbi:MAG: peptidase S8 [Pseudonocardiales bacterium]|nr:MAG: peptidase S8 [Pseudonocardiales bacterium]